MNNTVVGSSSQVLPNDVTEVVEVSQLTGRQVDRGSLHGEYLESVLGYGDQLGVHQEAAEEHTRPGLAIL